MQKFVKGLGLISLMLFSFYYTEKIALYMRLKTTLMQDIIKLQHKKNIKPVSAIISDNYIIPGINGLEIDINSSYSNMNINNKIDEKLLYYKQVKPYISLEDNKDKIINKGNPTKKSLSIIIDDKDLLTFFINHNIKCNYLINTIPPKYFKNVEYVNDGIDNYSQIEKSLNKNNLNHNLCIINNNNEKVCHLNNKYLIKPSYIINNSNIVAYLKKISSGDILYINNLSIDNVKILLKEIDYHNHKIAYLSTLISENNGDF